MKYSNFGKLSWKLFLRMDDTKLIWSTYTCGVSVLKIIASGECNVDFCVGTFLVYYLITELHTIYHTVLSGDVENARVSMKKHLVSTKNRIESFFDRETVLLLYIASNFEEPISFLFFHIVCRNGIVLLIFSCRIRIVINFLYYFHIIIGSRSIHSVILETLYWLISWHLYSRLW